MKKQTSQSKSEYLPAEPHDKLGTDWQVQRTYGVEARLGAVVFLAPRKCLQCLLVTALLRGW